MGREGERRSGQDGWQGAGEGAKGVPCPGADCRHPPLPPALNLHPCAWGKGEKGAMGAGAGPWGCGVVGHPLVLLAPIFKHPSSHGLTPVQKRGSSSPARPG